MKGNKGGGRRIPRQLKIIRGTFRKDRNPAHEADPELIPDVPQPPKYLGLYARNLWKKLAAEMVRVKILTTVDLPALELLCCAYDEFREARDAVYMGAKGKARTLAKYLKGKNSQTMPQYNAMKTARDVYKALAVEFGLTPASRNRIEITPPKDGKEDPNKAMKELLNA